MTSETRRAQLIKDLAPLTSRIRDIEDELKNLRAQAHHLQTELDTIDRAERQARIDAVRAKTRAMRSAYYMARLDRLRDFCAECNCIILERNDRSFVHDYVCWVCGQECSGRWAWDPYRGLPIGGGGRHIDGEYVSCADTTAEMVPELNLRGNFDPKSCWPCECGEGQSKWWPSIRKRRTDDLDLTAEPAELTESDGDSDSDEDSEEGEKREERVAEDEAKRRAERRGTEDVDEVKIRMDVKSDAPSPPPLRQIDHLLSEAQLDQEAREFEERQIENELAHAAAYTAFLQAAQIPARLAFASATPMMSPKEAASLIKLVQPASQPATRARLGRSQRRRRARQRARARARG